MQYWYDHPAFPHCPECKKIQSRVQVENGGENGRKILEGSGNKNIWLSGWMIIM